MKWTILTALLIISAESKNLYKRDSEPHIRFLGEVYKKVDTIDFRGLVLITLAQHLQKCPFEELAKQVEQITTLAQACAAGARHADCATPLITLFLNRICAVPELSATYDWSTECCAKSDPERHQCFRAHRNPAPGTHYKRPEPEELCESYKKNKEDVLAHYIYEVSRGHPVLYSPAVLGFAYQFNGICSHCCEEEDKTTCFKDRMTQLKKALHIVEVQQKESCRILDNFGVRVLQALKLVKISKKNPKATFEVAQKLTSEVTHLNEDCCHGDMLECMIERMELTEHTCEHHEDISTKLKTCCEKPLIERTHCIVNLENDDIPEDLPKKVTKFVEDPEVCKLFADKKDIFLAEFLYEYGRRHPELSDQLLLRIAKGYEHQLEKCCELENFLECLKDGEHVLADAIKESTELTEKDCAIQQKLGDYLFQNVLLIRYTKKMPHVTTPSLIHITKHMTEVGDKCCALPNTQKMPCAEGGLSLIIGEFCEMEKTHPINGHVKNCCWKSYSNRRNCFTNLGPDDSYVAPEITDDTFHFTEDLCTLPEEELKNKKQGFIATLVKVKPHVTDELYGQIAVEFTKMREKCCAAEDHQACFSAEEPILIEHCKQLAA
nr:albumin 1 [Bombina maxima]